MYWVVRNDDNQNSDEERSRISNVVEQQFDNINNINNSNIHEYSSGVQSTACQTSTCATNYFDSGINCSLESDLKTKYAEPNCVDFKSETLTSTTLPESNMECLSDNQIKDKCDDTTQQPNLSKNIDFNSNLSICSSEQEK